MATEEKKEHTREKNRLRSASIGGSLKHKINQNDSSGDLRPLTHVEDSFLSLEARLLQPSAESFYSKQPEFHVCECRRATPFCKAPEIQFDAQMLPPLIGSALKLYNKNTFRIVRFSPDAPVPLVTEAEFPKAEEKDPFAPPSEEPTPNHLIPSSLRDTGKHPTPTLKGRLGGALRAANDRVSDYLGSERSQKASEDDVSTLAKDSDEHINPLGLTQTHGNNRKSAYRSVPVDRSNSHTPNDTLKPKSPRSPRDKTEVALVKLETKSESVGSALRRHCKPEDDSPRRREGSGVRQSREKTLMMADDKRPSSESLSLTREDENSSPRRPSGASTGGGGSNERPQSPRASSPRRTHTPEKVEILISESERRVSGEEPRKKSSQDSGISPLNLGTPPPKKENPHFHPIDLDIEVPTISKSTDAAILEEPAADTPSQHQTELHQTLLQQLRQTSSRREMLVQAGSKLKIDPVYLGGYQEAKRLQDLSERKGFHADNMFMALLNTREEETLHKQTPIRQFWPTYPNLSRYSILFDEVVVEGLKSQPLIIFISLYDRITKQKRSEDFTFMWKSPQQGAPETATHRALFTWVQAPEDVLVLVARVAFVGGAAELEETVKSGAAGDRRTLWGVVGDKVVGDKAKKGSTPDRDKGSQSSSTAQSYDRRPILWGASAFPQKFTVPERRRIELVPPRKGFDDNSILEALDDSIKKKGKPAEGSFIYFKISMLAAKDTPEGIVDPSYNFLKPFNPNLLEFDGECSKLVKEIQPFPAEKDDKTVHFHYVNNLYLYPSKLSNFKTKSPLQLIVQLKDNDKNVNDPGLPAFFGLPFEQRFTSQYKTCISPPDSNKPFFDEIKILLPPHLTPKYHLLFTVISFEKDKDKKVKQEKMVVHGHAVFSFMKGERISLLSKEIPIVSLGNDYLSKDTEGGDSDKHGRSLLISMHLVSSIHNRLPNIQLISAHQGARFFPLVLVDMLKLLMNKNNQDIAKKTMLKFLEILQIIQIDYSLDTLFAFAPYMIDFEMNPDEIAMPLHKSLVKHFILAHREDKKFMDSFSLSGFFFHLVIRSMALYLADSKRDSLPHKERFDMEFQRELLEMYLLIQESDPNSYGHLGSGLIELLALMDRGIVLKMIQSFFQVQTTTQRALTKIGFFRAVSKYPNFVALNQPVAFDPKKIGDIDVEAFSESLIDKHFFVGALICEIRSSNARITPEDHSERQRRAQAIGMLRRLLGTHLETYKNHPQQLEIVLSMYFPYLLFFVQSNNSYWLKLIRQEEQSKNILQEHLSCFLFLLRHSSPALLEWWISKMETNDQLAILKILRDCLKCFTKEIKRVTTTERILSNQVALSLLDFVSFFIALHQPDLEDANDGASQQLFKNIFHILINLLVATRTCKIASPELLRVQICGIFHQCVDAAPKHFFRGREVEGGHDYLGELIYELMTICNSGNDKLRVIATSLLYKTLCSSYKASGQTSICKSRCNLAISKILGGEDLHSKFLAQSLEVIRQYASDDTAMPPEWEEDLSKMMNHLKNLTHQISSSRELGENSDSETLVSLYHEISIGFSNSPALRIAWLDFLKKHHEKEGNFLEAGQAEMHAASIMIHYFKKTDELPFVPAYVDAMIKNIAPDVPVLGEDQEASVFEGSLEDLEDRLHSAAEYFAKGTFYELSLEVQTLIGSLYRTSRNANLYDPLKKNLQGQISVVTKLTEQPDRMIPVYFRIGFYGQLWEARLNGKEFIYKKGASFTLPLMKSYLEQTFGSKYGSDLEILLTNTMVDVESLLPHKYYIQLAGVSPYVNSERASSHSTQLEQNFNINQFLFESAVHCDDMAQQSKKKTIFKTLHSFPYVENRIEVVGVQEILLAPIQNAFELIKTQTGKIVKLLHIGSNIRYINTIQQTLQGSVLPMVNPGPIKVCEIFLSEESVLKSISDPIYERDVQRLILAMRDFIKYSGLALSFNEQLCREAKDDKYAPFNKMLREKGYGPLKQVVLKACEDAEGLLLDIKKKQKIQQHIIGRSPDKIDSSPNAGRSNPHLQGGGPTAPGTIPAQQDPATKN